MTLSQGPGKCHASTPPLDHTPRRNPAPPTAGLARRPPVRAAPLLAALVGLLGLAVDATAQCAGSVAVGGVTSGAIVDDCEALLASKAQLDPHGFAWNWSLSTPMDEWKYVTMEGGRSRSFA